MSEKAGVSAAQSAEHRAALTAALRLPANRHCADCGARGPSWASVNLGVFVCLNCSGAHRSLGVHISKVRSVTLDTWLPEQVAFLCAAGNAVANAHWEARRPPGAPRTAEGDGAALRRFIVAKYERGEWAAAGEAPAAGNFARHPLVLAGGGGGGSGAGDGAAAPPPQQPLVTAPPPRPAARRVEAVTLPAESFDLLDLTSPAGAAPAAAAPRGAGADPFAAAVAPAAASAPAASAAAAAAAAASADLFAELVLTRAGGGGAGGGSAAGADEAAGFDPFALPVAAPAAPAPAPAPETAAVDPFALPVAAPAAPAREEPAAAPAAARSPLEVAPPAAAMAPAHASGASFSAGAAHARGKPSNEDIMALFK
jgi:stromal membrane-associated protein